MSLQLDAAKTLARHYLGITERTSVDVTNHLGGCLEGNMLIVDVGRKTGPAQGQQFEPKGRGELDRG